MPKRKRKKEDGSKKEIKYKGVEKKGSGRYLARIHIDSKKQGIGTFDTPKEAAQAYDLAAIQAGCSTSKLNFLDQVPKDYKPKKKKLSSRNTTGFTGVIIDGKTNRFQARIRIDGEQKQIGTFTKPRDAAMAYDEAIVENQLPWKKLNFPDGMPIEDQSDDDDGYWM